MTRALVIAPQWIGDAVMSEPLLGALAARGERLTVAALPWVAPVYRAVDGVAEIVELPFAHGRLDWKARWRAASQLRGRFDAAYVLPNSLKSALLPFLARVPRRVGYLGESRYGLLNRRLANRSGRPPMVDFYLALAGDAAAFRRAALAHRWQGNRGRARPTGPARQWLLRFCAGRRIRSVEALATRTLRGVGGPLAARTCPADPADRLGEGSASFATASLPRPVAHCRVLAGTTSLDQAMALMAGARGVVSNDSGLMHVAAAFGRAAGRPVRFDQSGAHAAAERPRQGALDERCAAARLHSLLRAQLSLRSSPLSGRSARRTRRCGLAAGAGFACACSEHQRAQIEDRPGRLPGR